MRHVDPSRRAQERTLRMRPICFEKVKKQKMPNSTFPLPDDRIPVIVGIGEIVDRPKEIAEGLEPLDLLEQALRRAEADSGAKLLGEIGSLDIVNFLSWRYRDPEIALSDRLGIKPAHAYYGPVGGESPIRYLHEAAQRIARGECSVAAVCGAEAQSTATKAERAGVTPPWTPFAHDVPEPKRGAAFQKPMAVKLGVFRPVTVYPFYEAATSAHWGQTPREAMAESGELWSRYSEAAAQNPNAWLKRRFAPEEITTPTADNRLIAWPYTKLQVANPTVNMGGGAADDQPCEGAGGRHRRRSPHPRLGRGIGGRTARLPDPRPVLPEPSAERGPEGGDGPRRRRRPRVRRHRALQLLSLRAENGAADAGTRFRRAADGDRRADVLRRAAQHLHDACGLRDGAKAARRRQTRPALRPGRVCDQTSRPGAVAAAAARRAGAGQQRAGGGRQPSRSRCPTSSPKPAARARSKALR